MSETKPSLEEIPENSYRSFIINGKKIAVRRGKGDDYTFYELTPIGIPVDEDPPAPPTVDTTPKTDPKPNWGPQGCPTEDQ